MNENISNLLKQIDELEEELRHLLFKQKLAVVYNIKGKRIEFEHAVLEAQQQFKTGLLRWRIPSRP